MPTEPTVIIHGDSWKRSDIKEAVAKCGTRSWQRLRWHPQPALVHRNGGVVSSYRGQSFDPQKIDLVPEGWDHDHCAICWWKLHATEDEQEGVGYTDGRGAWVCTECYQQFLGSPN